jgi:hypothetical protein
MPTISWTELWRGVRLWQAGNGECLSRAKRASFSKVVGGLYPVSSYPHVLRLYTLK